MRVRNAGAWRWRLDRSARARGALVLSVVSLVAVVVGSAGAANPASATTTTNQQLTASVSLSTTNDPVWLGTNVNASALATLGEGDTANVVYVADVSGSMENPGFNPFQPSVGDCDGDGLVGTALDSVCVGLIALNDSLGSAVNVNVGLVAFGDGGKTADMGPGAGAQTFTSPPDNDANSNTVPDADEVIHSLSTEFGGSGSAGIGQFTSDITAGFAFNTNYDAALTNMNAAFATQPAGDINTGFFLSDGEPTTFTTGAGSPLQDAINAGTKILTFGIGGGAAGSCAARRGAARDRRLDGRNVHRGRGSEHAEHDPSGSADQHQDARAEGERDGRRDGERSRSPSHSRSRTSTSRPTSWSVSTRSRPRRRRRTTRWSPRRPRWASSILR